MFRTKYNYEKNRYLGEFLDGDSITKTADYVDLSKTLDKFFPNGFPPVSADGELTDDVASFDDRLFELPDMQDMLEADLAEQDEFIRFAEEKLKSMKLARMAKQEEKVEEIPVSPSPSEAEPSEAQKAEEAGLE
ncbi:hypothetical protein [Sigmofec virus UA08Rod_6800]|uniref:Uncharacterized protein n=1 Tax=Sigmofec virus UA08Rod_6800 TaxID=2929240 RepID=A0A976R554_9VIRU|nr:hypothetical protein [Sigmofec virus UA08Rod_6800]